MTYNVFGRTLNVTQLQFVASFADMPQLSAEMTQNTRLSTDNGWLAR